MIWYLKTPSNPSPNFGSKNAIFRYILVILTLTRTLNGSSLNCKLKVYLPISVQNRGQSINWNEPKNRNKKQRPHDKSSIPVNPKIGDSRSSKQNKNHHFRNMRDELHRLFDHSMWFCGDVVLSVSDHCETAKDNCENGGQTKSFCGFFGLLNWLFKL